MKNLDLETLIHRQNLLKKKQTEFGLAGLSVDEKAEVLTIERSIRDLRAAIARTGID